MNPEDIPDSLFKVLKSSVKDVLIGTKESVEKGGKFKIVYIEGDDVPRMINITFFNMPFAILVFKDSDPQELKKSIHKLSVKKHNNWFVVKLVPEE